MRTRERPAVRRTGRNIVVWVILILAVTAVTYIAATLMSYYRAGERRIEAPAAPGAPGATTPSSQSPVGRDADAVR